MIELTTNYSIHTPIKYSLHNEIFQEVTQEVIVFLYLTVARTETFCGV